MRSADIDVSSLIYQLREDNIALEVANEGLEKDIAEALPENHGVVVLEHTPPHIPNVRDLAQDLANETGIDTVIVRTPDVAIAVSSSLTRAQVEQGERAMVAQPDYGDGLRAFLSTSTQTQPAWLPIVLAIAFVAAVVVVASWRAAKRSIGQDV
ncbi:DUF6676 family protein [Corynebacterium sp. HMSC29G08]|uniref:Rv1476 family membrane protein n=1 Tax=Corynebacterium sp. HMSC29G08 TaxID=1581069 RepID=UPI0008A5FCDB|nr:DUF6676 family protein [Corynebacterium sp. HMSC29G08]OFT85871.1 hypothetical protein HMPREF3101_02020 [Corynebacterium sp. HMSC29G08]